MMRFAIIMLVFVSICLGINLGLIICNRRDKMITIAIIGTAMGIVIDLSVIFTII